MRSAATSSSTTTTVWRTTLCKAAGVSLWDRGDQKDPEFWAEIVPVALEEACERLGPEHKFDAIVVDEGQDFKDLWWDSLQSVFRDVANKACYYVFYDPNQNLFVDNPSLPDELGPPYALPDELQEHRPHRRTLRVARRARQPGARRGADGEDPVMVSVGTVSEAFRAAGKHVRELCESGQGGLQPSQAAVLAPAFTEKEWPEKFGTIALTRDFDEWRRGEGVLIATWGRFKGLEADAVVSVETPMRKRSAGRRRRATSRARAPSTG